MSDLENKEQRTFKRPYNLREKQKKSAVYRELIRPELADALYTRILDILVVNKKYRDPDYSAKELANDLETNSRYLSAVINSRFAQSFPSLINEYRIKEAKNLLVDKRYVDKSVLEISTMVGFSNRQSFYSSFFKHVGMAPHAYRKEALLASASSKK